jgi:uncharacterized protein
MDAHPVSIEVPGQGHVSGLLQEAPSARALYLFAHGAGMRHPFMADMAAKLAERGISSLRYQFPYMEKGSGRPDAPAVACATVRAAAAFATGTSKLRLFAGGKSFGARMTSLSPSENPLPKVLGLIFLGFPLHPPGKPSDQRAEHLLKVQIPMLFLQGNRDEFARLDLLENVVGRLSERATLKLFPGADHSFHVPKRSGRSDSDIRGEIADEMASWINAVIEK